MQHSIPVRLYIIEIVDPVAFIVRTHIDECKVENLIAYWVQHINEQTIEREVINKGKGKEITLKTRAQEVSHTLKMKN